MDKLSDILNSVLKDAISKPINRGGSVTDKIKVKHNAARDTVLDFRGITLFFDSQGIAETEAYNKEIIEIEQMYRPGCFSFIVEEAKVEEDITVDEFLAKARKELEESELDKELPQEEITKEQTPKKGKKGK
jgi:hypothetical protein